MCSNFQVYLGLLLLLFIKNTIESDPSSNGVEPNNDSVDVLAIMLDSKPINQSQETLNIHARRRILDVWKKQMCGRRYQFKLVLVQLISISLNS